MEPEELMLPPEQAERYRVTVSNSENWVVTRLLTTAESLEAAVRLAEVAGISVQHVLEGLERIRERQDAALEEQGFAAIGLNETREAAGLPPVPGTELWIRRIDEEPANGAERGTGRSQSAAAVADQADRPVRRIMID